MIFKNVLTALITPFQGGKLDSSALKILIERQIKAGIGGIVVGGSTGEGSSLADSEYDELITEAVKCAGKRIAIIAGITAISTASAVEKVRHISVLGVDGLMCTVPHYVRPEQEGLFLHFKELNDASSLPIMLYIHPGRTGCDMSDDTLLRLAKLDKIMAVKDASSDLEKPLRILPQVSDFNLLTGDDSRVLGYNAHGGAGCVSVMSNIFPKICVKINALWKEANAKKASELQQKLMPVIAAISAESNPIGIKYAAFKMNLCSDEIRLPLTKSSKETAQKIDQTLMDLIKIEENV